MNSVKTKQLVIFGLGDIAKLAAEYFNTDTEYRVVAYTVDADYLPDSGLFLGLPVVPFDHVQNKFPPALFEMFVALSYAKMNKVREGKYHDAKNKGYQLASYISPYCTMLSKEAIGDNCFILEDNTIQPFVKIGCNVTLWSGNHIGHDSVIENHTFISSHVVVSGHCQVGRNCFLGVNSTLKNGISVGNESIIGAGVTLMKNSLAGQVFLAPRPFLYEKSSSEVDL